MPLSEAFRLVARSQRSRSAAFGSGMAGVAFYPDGRIGHGHGQANQPEVDEQQGNGTSDAWGGNGSWANWQNRRASYESSTAFGESWNRTWSDSGWSYGDHGSSGRWWCTPVMWVWGETLDDGIRDCARRGWLHLDRAFCAWWSEQGESKSSSNTSSYAGWKPADEAGVGDATNAEQEDSCSSRQKRGSGMGDSASVLDGGDMFEEKDEMDGQVSSKSGDKSSEGKRSQPFTGKEHIPGHDGQITMREYQRRVKLFQSNTAIDPCFQAGKLIEKLTGQAWECCETLDVSQLKSPQGVQKLLDHLWMELEPLEHLRVFSTLSEFYQKFHRGRGQQFTAYDTAFRAQCLRLKECGAPLTGTALAFWFLEKANISDELKRQVVSGANGTYEYTRLRESLVAIVPQVGKPNDEKPSGNKWYGKQQRGSHRVHAVMKDDGEGHTKPDEDGAGSSGSGMEGVEAEELEMEAEVLLTHAARKRAAADRNRGFAKQESSEDREKRIATMKTMACAACKSHGITAFGHWHGDRECPFYDDNKKDGKSKPVFVVSQEPVSGEDSDEAFIVQAVILATSSGLREMTRQVALADTCCARTVAGVMWMKEHLKDLAEKGVPHRVIPDSQPFRFGDGPKIKAFCAVLMPIYVGESKTLVLLKVSVVDEDVPLLVSSKALKAMGGVVDLDHDQYLFRKIKVKVPMVTTPSGHVGFNVLGAADLRTMDLMRLDWEEFAKNDSEVAFGRTSKDRVVTYVQSFHMRM